MAPTKQAATPNGSHRLVDSIEDAQQSTLAAVRRLVDTVDGAFPVLSDDYPRRKIIDSAFDIVDQLVGASNQFVRKVFEVTEKQLGIRPGSKAAPKKAAAA